MLLKRYIYIILFLCFCNTISSQDTIQFPMEDASWDNQYTPSEGVVWPFNYVARYELLGDTLISSLNYAKIYKTWSMGYHQIVQCEFTYFDDPIYNQEYIGALRNDGQQHVYFVPIDSLVEILMYDFSIQQGDSFQFLFQDLGVFTDIVQSVDSILIQDSYRKRVHFGWTDTWVDGIGSINGLFYTYLDPFTGYEAYELICFRESNNPVYYSYAEYCGDMWCNLATDISSSPENTTHFQIYPNPIIDVSRISIEEDINLINIYNVSGNKIITYYPDSESIEIRRNDFEQGLYVIEAITNDQCVYHQKVVIK